MRVTIVAGARPNFLKVAPLIREIERVRDKGANIGFRLVHTGQHYDNNLSQVFFEELGIPMPDANLEAGSGSQSVQTAGIMVAFEQELETNPADMVIVVGDVNSTLACSIVAKKMHIPVAHVEAGIRSFDITMPEEINRIVTDAVADYFFTTSETANENLMRSGANAANVFYVGNIMIDSLYMNRARFCRPAALPADVDIHKSIVLTLHRPHNVDDAACLADIVENILQVTEGYHIIFPMHPRTGKTWQQTGIAHQRLVITEPLGYLSFIHLVSNCKAVVTDSGGVQEETTVLGVPCITLRNNTERPETVSIGTNELAGDNREKMRSLLQNVISGHWKEGGIPPLWDGKTAQRIVSILLEIGRQSGK